MFALALPLVGPGYWLVIPIAVAGQLLVALVLGEVASRHPLEGSLYAWAGRLLGPAYGWFTGWAYMWTVLIALVTVAVGATQFWGAALAIDVSAKSSLIVGSIIVLAFATVSNLLSRRVLRMMIALSIAAEVIGSVGLGITLLLFYDVNSISTVFDNGGNGWTMSALLLGIGFAGWSFLGFESSGSIGEEVQDARRNVPKALRYSLLAIAAIVMLSTLSLILAIPDLGAVMAGEDVDPVGTALTTHLGETVTRLAFGVFAIGFTACCLGLQTGLSRVIWAFARDRALPAAGWLSGLSVRERIPARAVAVTAILPLPIFLLTGSQVYNVLVGYTIGGWYLTFALVLVAALLARRRGTWAGGPVHARPLVAPGRDRRARLGRVRDDQRRLAARDRQRAGLVPAVGGRAGGRAAGGGRLGRLRDRPQPDRPVRGELMYDWPPVDEAALLADRRARVADVMQEEGLDGLLLSGFDNIRYASGFRANLTYDSNYEWYALLLDRDMAGTLLACDVGDPLDAGPGTADRPPGRRAVLAGGMGAAGDVRAAARGRDARDAPRRGRRPAVRRRRRAARRAELVPVAGALLRRRMIKTADEIRLVEASCEVASLAMSAAMSGFTEGMTDVEIVNLANDVSNRCGVEWISHAVIIVQATPGRASWLPSGRRVWAGDTFFVDYGVYGAGGYASDFCRTHVAETAPTRSCARRTARCARRSRRARRWRGPACAARRSRRP